MNKIILIGFTYPSPKGYGGHSRIDRIKILRRFFFTEKIIYHEEKAVLRCCLTERLWARLLRAGPFSARRENYSDIN